MKRSDEAINFWDVFYNSSAQARFRFDTRIILGAGCLEYLPQIYPEFGEKIVILMDRQVQALPLATSLIDSLRQSSTVNVVCPENGEPTEAYVYALRDEIRKYTPDVLVTVGGGSTLDLGKALSVLLYVNEPEVCEALSKLNSQALECKVPVIAVPTTAGTGAEVSRFVVLTESDGQKKRGFRSWYFCPDVALVDPRFLQSLSAKQLLLGALDSSVHCYEAFICKNERSPLTDLICLEGIRNITDTIEKIVEGDRDSEVLQKLSLSASYGGMALTNVRLGLVHRCGEALASLVPLLHAHSLGIFFKEAVTETAPYLSSFWQRARQYEYSWRRFDGFAQVFDGLFELILKHKLDCLPNGCISAPEGDDLVDSVATEVLNDHVLLKEHPAPWGKRQINEFVSKCLSLAVAR